MNRKLLTLAALAVSFVFIGGVSAAEQPKPFGLTIGKMNYSQVLETLSKQKWEYHEYHKKHLSLVGRKDPDRGKNTFLLAEPEDVEGVKNMLVFFNGESVLDAVIVVLDPKLFEVVWDELDKKYDFVSKNLGGDYQSSDYPRILWQKDRFYIELQKMSPHRVRIVYVEKVLYENYKDFLQKTYEPFHRKKTKKAWMESL